MLSYKKINLLDLRLCEDFSIKNKEEILEIKSPIITYNLKESLLYLNINKHSESHNLFMNICGYIDRLFKITDIASECMKNENIILNLTEDSKFYDENSKLINSRNVKKEGKMICSFTCDKGKFNLKNLLLIK
jgi:hypothetical protein